MLIRCHMLGKIMTEPKEKKEVLSVGAKTILKSLAKQEFYGFENRVDGKYTDKGLIVEQQSIDLYNSVFFTNYQKNTERRNNKWLTGECDIFKGKDIGTTDIKSSWSLATFPALSEDAHDKEYEWQGRGYMMLWDTCQHEVAHCMVNTPDELIKYEDQGLHYVDHIPKERRITLIAYERDEKLEALIRVKCEAAQEYYQRVIEQINKEHDL